VVSIESIGAMMLKLHEIWRDEGKRHSDQDSRISRVALFRRIFENNIFAIFSNIVSPINFSLKVRIKLCLF